MTFLQWLRGLFGPSDVEYQHAQKLHRTAKRKKKKRHHARLHDDAVRGVSIGYSLRSNKRRRS